MSERLSPQQELDRLLDRLCDARQFTTDDRDRLADLLRGNPQLRQRYLERMELHSTLWLLGGESDEGKLHHEADPSDELAPTRSSRSLATVELLASETLRRRPRLVSFTVAAAVLLIVVTAMAFMVPPFYRSMTSKDEKDRPDSHRIVAKLTGLHDADWAPGQLVTHRGGFLQSGHRMELREGFAEVTFTSGAIVVVESPAILVVQDALRCRLEAGKIVGKVPPSATGFSVVTPSCEVIDLGTEFGVDVTGKRSGVQVFEGSVALVSGSGPTAASQRQVIRAGEAVVVDQSGLVLKAEPTDARAFRRQMPAGPRLVDVTPPFVGGKNYSRIMYSGVQRANQADTVHIYDAAVGSPSGNQYAWLDLSDALPQLAAEQIDRVFLRWQGEVIHQVATQHGGKPGVEAELGIFSVPDDRRGIPTIFARGDGNNNVKFYAAHLDEVVDTLTVPAVGKDRRFVARWDITQLVQYWIDNPAAPRRGQLIIINRQHPVWVKWQDTPRVHAHFRPDDASDATDSHVSDPPRESPPGDLER